MTNPSPLKVIDNRIHRLTALKIIEKKMNKLSSGSGVGNPKHAERFAEERHQLSMISDELKKIETKSASTVQSKAEIEALQREMGMVAQKVAAMSLDDPHRHDVLNEFTRLAIIADSIDRYER